MKFEEISSHYEDECNATTVALDDHPALMNVEQIAGHCADDGTGKVVTIDIRVGPRSSPGIEIPVWGPVAERPGGRGVVHRFGAYAPCRESGRFVTDRGGSDLPGDSAKFHRRQGLKPPGYSNEVPAGTRGLGRDLAGGSGTGRVSLLRPPTCLFPPAHARG